MIRIIRSNNFKNLFFHFLWNFNVQKYKKSHDEVKIPAQKNSGIRFPRENLKNPRESQETSQESIYPCEKFHFSLCIEAIVSKCELSNFSVVTVWARYAPFLTKNDTPSSNPSTFKWLEHSTGVG